MDMFWAARSHARPVRGGGRDTNTEDAVLMSRIAAGDEAAMHGLFSRHNIAVYRFLLQQLRDKALAEEVTSEVFLDVWRHPRGFEGRSTVLTWILANARRKALSARSNRRSPGFDRPTIRTVPTTRTLLFKRRI